MKYLYVLTSDQNDYYLEQALMSITSLKLHTPNGFVSLLIDDMTKSLLKDNRKKILNMVDEVQVVSPPVELNKMQRSRWLKTTMREHIAKDFLYIDCDSIIAEDISGIDNFNFELGAVPDEHVIFNNEYRAYQYILSIMKRIDFKFSPMPNYYFNGGLIFSRDTELSHKFFKEWNSLWIESKNKGNSTDMPALNQANINLGQCIQELDGKWNCQILYGGLPYLSTAKIIHYFSSSKDENPYILGDHKIYSLVREEGISNDIIKKIIMSKSLFKRQVIIIADKKILKFVNTFSFIFRCENLLKWLYRIIEFLLRIKNFFLYHFNKMSNE